MIQGDRVRIYPHGSPQQAAGGSIAILPTNGLAILVLLDYKPPFATGPILWTDKGIPFFGRRMEINGTPWGPWIEIFNGGHYEIEEVPVPPRAEDDNV